VIVAPAAPARTCTGALAQREGVEWLVAARLPAQRAPSPGAAPQHV